MILVCLNEHLEEGRRPFLLKGVVSPPASTQSPAPALLLYITGVDWRWRNNLKPNEFKIIKAMKNCSSLKLHCVKNSILILLPSFLS